MKASIAHAFLGFALAASLWSLNLLPVLGVAIQPAEWTGVTRNEDSEGFRRWILTEQASAYRCRQSSLERLALAQCSR